MVECTSQFRDPTIPPDDKKGSIRGHLAAGAKVVINSSPFKIKDKALRTPEDAITLIYGINQAAFDKKNHSVSVGRLLYHHGIGPYGQAPAGK